MGAIRLLLVEDNRMDVRIFERALRQAGIDTSVTVARDGREALDILRGANGVQPFQRPNMILLDLHMPRMNGLEFLQEIRADPKLGDLVVFVLTTSDAPEDKAQAYKLHIAGYVLKSDPERSFVEAIEMFDSYACVVELP
jgi:CheY-like chemotaxis protein